MKEYPYIFSRNNSARVSSPTLDLPQTNTSTSTTCTVVSESTFWKDTCTKTTTEEPSETGGFPSLWPTLVRNRIKSFNNPFLAGCLAMRGYDNAAYDYFYFSD